MKSIFRKEYTKLWKPILVLLIIHVLAAAHFLLDLRGLFIHSSSFSIWSTIVYKEVNYFSSFKDVIMASGFILGVLQFYPETAGKRFRISCHLPIREFKMTSIMIFSGFISLTAIWLFDVLVAYLASVKYFPHEIYSQVPIMMFYWYVNALILYGYASILVLEPSWSFKIAFGVLLTGALQFIQSVGYYSEPIYAVVMLCLAITYMLILYYPALRFRTGE